MPDPKAPPSQQQAQQESQAPPASQTHPTPPSQEGPKSPGSGLLFALIALLAVGLIGAGVYAWHQHTVAERAAAENSQVAAALQSTNTQVEQLNAKLNQLTAPKPTPEPTPAPPVVVHLKKKPGVAGKPHVRPDDPRWKKFQEQLDSQGKAIDSTRQDLSSTRTELQTSIARTHDEVVALQKKGERNYFEFDIDKDKGFKRSGPVGIRLKKANTKKQYADLELMVDDVPLTQKHVNRLQPIVFYAAEESDLPVELVINGITKNHIRGYVSAPKYRRSERATASADGSQPSEPPKQRQKLSSPK